MYAIRSYYAVGGVDGKAVCAKLAGECNFRGRVVKRREQKFAGADAETDPAALC